MTLRNKEYCIEGNRLPKILLTTSFDYKNMKESQGMTTECMTTSIRKL